MKTRPVSLVVCAVLALARVAPGADSQKPPTAAAAAGKSRIKFVAYDIDHAAGDRTKDTFQINILGQKQPTVFLSIGGSFRVGDTGFTILRFEQKRRPHPTLGEEDVSELTVLNTATKEPVVLTIQRVTEVVAGPAPKSKRFRIANRNRPHCIKFAPVFR